MALALAPRGRGRRAGGGLSLRKGVEADGAEADAGWLIDAAGFEVGFAGLNATLSRL